VKAKRLLYTALGFVTFKVGKRFLGRKVHEATQPSTHDTGGPGR
jgi:hypothetical protein